MAHRFLAEVRVPKLDTPGNVGYFCHVKIVEAKPQGRFQVFLRFDDGAAGTVDLSDLAGNGVFCAWEQPGVFEQLFISPVGALEWPGELDLCPDALYMQMTGKPVAEIFPAVRALPVHA